MKLNKGENKMDMNKVRDMLHEALEKWGCSFEFKRGKCWITSPVGRMGFQIMYREYDITGLKIGRTKIPFGESFEKDLCAKISELGA